MTITGGNCPGSVLTVHSDIPAGVIQWNFNGNPIKQVYGTWQPNGITVAGGNGYSYIPDTVKANQIFSDFFCMDSADNMYICQFGNNVVTKWMAGATSGTTVAGGNGPGSAANQLGEVIDACVDRAGNLYVVDYQNYRVQKWAPGATSGITVAGGNGEGPGLNQFGIMFTISIDSANNLYIVDATYSRIVKWAPGATSGVIVAGGNNAGPSTNQLNSPEAAWLDKNGILYIVDRGNYRIMKWTPGAPQGTVLPITYDFNDGVTGINVDGIGNVYLAYSGTNRIKQWIPGTNGVINVAGDTTTLFGSGPNQFFDSWSVYVDAMGNMFVDDQQNMRIQKFLPQISDTLTAQFPGTYTATITTYGGKTATASFIIDPVSSVAIATTAQDSICVGTNIAFTATMRNEGNNPVFQWKVNGNNTGTNSPSFNTNSLRSSDSVQCILIPKSGCTSPSASNIIQVTLEPILDPSIVVVASDTTICKGSTVQFKALATNGGHLPKYQWTINGIVTASIDSVFQSNTLSDYDIVSCMLTTSNQCVIHNSVSSNSILIRVSNSIAPSVSINADRNKICEGATAFFSAVPVNGGSSPVYQWLVNGTAVGSNSQVFQSSSIHDGDKINCVLVSNISCAPKAGVSSNTLSITVQPLVQPKISLLASSDTICAGGNVTFHAITKFGGTLPSFHWSLNGSAINESDSVFVSSSLTISDKIQCTMISNENCVMDSEAMSNIIIINVKPLLHPALEISTLDTTFCSGAVAVFSAKETDGGTNPSYLWLVNGTTTKDTLQTFKNKALHDRDIISCILTSNAMCITKPTALSNSIAVHVVDSVQSKISIAASTNDVCFGQPVSFSTNSSGGGATPSYQWQVNGNVVGGNGPIYQSALLQGGDVISCQLKSSESCSEPVLSNSIVMTIRPLPVIAVAATDTALLYGHTTQLQASSTTNIIKYSWSPINGLSNPTISDPLASPSQSINYLVTGVADDGCSASASIHIGVFRTLYMPNAFTPNGDGKNDLFRIPPGIQITLKNFTIYNRWGKIVFNTSNPEDGWDGYLNGLESPSGTYVYIISGSDTKGKIYLKGSVTLIR